MQNMMRNQDLAMSQIENMPGGYNALRRMYEDVQEPMIDALAGGGSTGTTGSGSGNNAGRGSAGNGTAGATNQAMPNPWGAPASTPTNQAAGGVGANPFASLMGSTGGMGMPGAGAGAAHNPWANPMMGPNAPNLEATLQMMENPMMQNMMQNMMSNPETMRMMMDSNPMVRSQCFCFLEYHGHCFVSVCILPLNQDESNDGSKKLAFHGANATEYAATFR
jgi:ubiquilin